MASGFQSAYDDEHKQDHSGDAKRYFFKPSNTGQSKWVYDYTNSLCPKGLKVGFEFDEFVGKVYFTIDDGKKTYIQIESRIKFEKMIQDLKIINPSNLFSKIREVCDWYILDSQYATFEEVKNG